MRKVSYTQTATGTWAADSSGISTDLDKTGLITRVDATVEVTPSATLAGANQPDGPWRLIQNLRIEGGSHTYVTLPADDACMGGTMLHYLNIWDRLGQGHSTGAITAPSRTYQPFNFCLHFGARKFDTYGRDNKFDLTGFIPGYSESQLRAIWVTSGNDVMDDTVTISSATMRYTLHVVQGTDGELRTEMARQGVGQAMIPAWIAEVFPHSATSSDYSTDRDVPTGAFLKRIIIACQDATATRSLRAQDEVTGIAVKLNQQNETIIRQFVDNITGHLPAGGGSYLEADDAAIDGGMLAPQGFFVVDLGPHAISQPDYGLDLRPLSTGAVKLGLTITTYASGDDSLLIYERYAPFVGKLAAL